MSEVVEWVEQPLEAINENPFKVGDKIVVYAFGGDPPEHGVIEEIRNDLVITSMFKTHWKCCRLLKERKLAQWWVLLDENGLIVNSAKHRRNSSWIKVREIVDGSDFE